MSAKRSLVVGGSAGILDLKEALEPPNLEDALANDHAELENAPPLHPRVRGLSRVAMCSLADDDIALFVLDLGEEFGHLFHY